MEEIVDDYIEEQILISTDDIFSYGLNRKYIYNTIKKCVMNVLIHDFIDRKDED
jgi:hypothetical protein